MARHSSLLSPALPADSVWSRATRLFEQTLGERARLMLVLLIALAQGALFLVLLPPWQHYDEPTHFEYAWLIANHNNVPAPGHEDAAMRRELAASMIEYDFYKQVPQPKLLTNQRVNVGVTELLHPPAYYALVSLPLRLVSHLDLVSQLYVARGVSLLLFLATVAISFGLVCDLTTRGHPLRWAVPLGVALLPSFADLMTAVNNDAGAAAVFSLFLWGAVRLIRRGLDWRRLLWVFGTAILAALTKNTAAIALGLAPLACLLAYWQQRGWRWLWLALVVGNGLLALCVVALTWGDAAYWYREGAPTQPAATRVATSTPLGSHALLMDVPTGKSRILTNPITNVDEAGLAGKTLTIGGWVWAERTVTAQIGLGYKTPNTAMSNSLLHRFTVTTKPTFVAWTIVVPDHASALYYRVGLGLPASAEPVRMYLDGSVLAVGAFPTTAAPTFDDAAATSGTWAGIPFRNLVRNASAETAWPRMRPWLNDTLFDYIHRSPEQSVAAFFDLGRILPAVVPYMIQPAMDSFVQVFAWSNVRLSNPIWLQLASLVAVMALVGGLSYLYQRRKTHANQITSDSLGPAIAFLALVGLLIWLNTILRPLPLLGELYVAPVARYTFPAIVVAILAVMGGWWALWPQTLRTPMVLLLLGCFIALDAAAIRMIQFYY